MSARYRDAFAKPEGETMDIRAGGRSYRFVRYDSTTVGDARRSRFLGAVGPWEVELDHIGECAWAYSATCGERQLASDHPLPTPAAALEELLAAAEGRVVGPRPAPAVALRVAVPGPSGTARETCGVCGRSVGAWTVDDGGPVCLACGRVRRA